MYNLMMQDIILFKCPLLERLRGEKGSLKLHRKRQKQATPQSQLSLVPR
jgi:hypothetical protein